MVADQPTGMIRYSTGAAVLHWAIAGLMLAQIASGFAMGEGHSAASFARIQLHKSVGITILLLTLARVGWRLFAKPPAPLVHGWEARLASVIHALFYLLLILLPLTGWLMVSVSPTHIPTLLYGLVPWPHLPGFEGISAATGEAIDGAAGEVHEIAAFVAIAAIALHVMGAIKHQFLDHDLTFARISLGGTRGLGGRMLAVLAAAVAAILFGAWFQPPAPGPATAAPASGTAAQASAPAVSPSAAASATPAEEPTEDAGALAQWRVQGGGKLGFTTSWSGAALNGSFPDWSADIAFGEAALDKSHVRVTVKTGSARTGQEQPDSALPGADWFATEMFPTATFDARRFRKTGEGRFVADGTLTIRGKSLPLSLPFTLRIDGDTARMNGSTAIDRTAYGVGFPATGDIPAEAKVNVSFTARRVE